eukprot:489597_1
MVYMKIICPLLFALYYTINVSAISCGSQSQKVEKCDLNIDVQCALDHGSMVYWGTAEDKSSNNPYGHGPTTSYYSNADDAGEEAIILLFQNLGPNRCNCVQSNITYFGIVYELNICYQFASPDDLTKKTPIYKVWARNTRINQYGYFCCEKNYTIAAEYAMKAVSLCSEELQKPNVYIYNVSQEIKVMKQYYIMSPDCHFQFEVDPTPTKNTNIKLRQYNVTSGSNYHSMWDYENNDILGVNEEVYFEGHSNGNIVFKDGNKSKVLWQSNTDNQGKEPYQFELSMSSGRFKYKDSKGNDIWSVGKNKRAD